MQLSVTMRVKPGPARFFPLERRHAALTAQQRQLDAAAGQRLELHAVADGIEAFCQAIRAGLTTALATGMTIKPRRFGDTALGPNRCRVTLRGQDLA